MPFGAVFLLRGLGRDFANLIGAGKGPNYNGAVGKAQLQQIGGSKRVMGPNYNRSVGVNGLWGPIKT